MDMKLYNQDEFALIPGMPRIMKDIIGYPKPYYLEIGCGDFNIIQPTSKWLHSDCSLPLSRMDNNHLEVGCYSWCIPFENESCAEIFAKGFWEHLSYSDARRTLVEWNRVLIPGGKIRLNFPPIDHAIHLYNTKQVDITFLMHILYGWQMQDTDIHRSGWTKEIMEEFIAEHGQGLSIEEIFWGDFLAENGEVTRYEGDPYTYAGGHLWVVLRK
jgi:predicted SAM-dependent methyltransferase